MGRKDERPTIYVDEWEFYDETWFNEYPLPAKIVYTSIWQFEIKRGDIVELFTDDRGIIKGIYDGKQFFDEQIKIIPYARITGVMKYQPEEYITVKHPNIIPKDSSFWNHIGKRPKSHYK